MPVKCRDCGYLAKHVLSPRAGSSRYHEVDIDERDNPQAFFKHVVEGFVGDLESELVCFMGKADLMAECETDLGQASRNALALRAVRIDRECDGFLPHRHGFGPKEHHETYNMQRLEQDRREFEERLAARDAEVHTALVRAQQAFQLERERAQEPTTNLMRRLTWLAVGLAAVQVLIGLSPESLLVKAVVKLWRLILG